jgi:hypothetical protein
VVGIINVTQAIVESLHKGFAMTNHIYSCPILVLMVCQLPLIDAQVSFHSL